MKKKKRLNQKRYLQGEEPSAVSPKADGVVDEIMLEHIRELVSVMEDREISLDEARQLVEALAAQKKGDNAALKK